MDLGLNETQEMLRTAAHDFIERECPITAALALDKTDTAFSPEMWKKMAELGWAGMLFPEEYGGLGSPLTDVAVIHQELGWGGIPSPLLSSALCGLAILEGGTERQRKELLPIIARGEKVMALALTEADGHWRPESVHLSATARDGGYVLNGTKLYVHDAHIADYIICAARTRQSRDPEQGITLFLVDKNAPGVSCRTLTGFVGEKANEVVFDSVQVGRSAVIGGVNRGWSALTPAIDKARILLCAYIVGGIQRVWELTVDYCRTRVQFGVYIGTFQRVQDHVINQVNALDAARWTTYEALWKMDTGKADASRAVMLAKILASEGYYEACNAGHEVHAGTGVDKGYPLYLHTKKSRTYFHYLGDPIALRKQLGRLLCEE